MIWISRNGGVEIGLLSKKKPLQNEGAYTEKKSEPLLQSGRPFNSTSNTQNIYLLP